MERKKLVCKSFIIVLFAVLLSVLCMLACSCTNNAKKDSGPVTCQALDNTKNLTTFANLDVDMSTEDFLKHFSYGDVLNVKIEGVDELTMPVCGSFDDVSAGELCICAKEGASNVTLAIVYGQFAVQYGLAQKNPDGSATKYSPIPGKLPCNVTFTMKQEGGYKDRIEVGKLKESKDKNDYPKLSDEQFANFREVKCGNIRSGVLFRSSSPIDPQIGRNTYADQACANNKMVSALNLQDTEQEAKAYEGFSNTYYSKMNVTYLKMSMSLGTADFNKNIATSLRFFINNDGPYLCHCVYGKDRTGFVCAVVEALCGASKTDIENDYLTTYTNLYNVVDGKQQPIDDSLQNTIKGIIISNMQYAYGGAELTDANINQKTEEYVKSIGLTQAEIDQLRAKLK